MFLGKGVLKICCKFTGEHPCWNVICKFIEIVLQHGWRIFPDAPSFLVELNSWLKFSYGLYRPNSKAKKPVSDSGIILSWITGSILIWISTRVRMVDIVSYFKESITIQFQNRYRTNLGIFHQLLWLKWMFSGRKLPWLKILFEKDSSNSISTVT